MSVAESQLRSTAPARSREATRRRLADAGTELFASERPARRHELADRAPPPASRRAPSTCTSRTRKRSSARSCSRRSRDLRERGRIATLEAGADPRAQVRARTDRARRVRRGEPEPDPRPLRPRPRGGRRRRRGARLADARDRGGAPRAASPPGQLAPEFHAGVAAQAIAAMSSRVIAWWVEDPTRATRERSDRDALPDASHPPLERTHGRPHHPRSRSTTPSTATTSRR